MAKAPAKKIAAKKKAAPTKTKTLSPSLEKNLKAVLGKLQSLNIDAKLQADIEWCLGSYGYDKNPTGLIEMGSKAVAILKNELSKKTKGITAKLISDLEKSLKSA